MLNPSINAVAYQSIDSEKSRLLCRSMKTRKRECRLSLKLCPFYSIMSCASIWFLFRFGLI